MKKIIVSIIVVFSLLLSSVSIYAASFEDGVGKDEIPYGEDVEGVTGYTYTDFNMMTADEAAAANIPEGYSGYVLALTNVEGTGITLDLSEQKVVVNAIESITFRVYCTANVREVRITDDAGASWISRVVPSATEEWIDVTITKDGDNISKSEGMACFADENGYFKPVNFGFRFTDSESTTVYIDSITFNMKEADTVAPVITYNGESAISTTEGKTFELDLTVWDEYEERAITPEYIWSDGALDENGLLTAGEHSCTVRATDTAGNSSEITLTVTVGKKDVTAPEIDWSAESISALVGARCLLNIFATDDTDGEIEAELTWSNGALDNRGRLTEGEHTLTITATDATGNTTQKTVKVVVVTSIDQLD
ncbi:MAG: hypothetical protein E7592_01290 [Ruminococcaceae bacterium]|nr:hypothetical protein [Oscillospiraceae bacterium]